MTVLEPRLLHRVRELRYGDGLSCPKVAALTGLSADTVKKHAPGRPGKVPNVLVREAFLSSGVSASAVARDMGWYSGRSVDASRVRRALGLTLDRSGTRTSASLRRTIDAELAMNIAEACGVPGWSVLPDEDSVAA